jgi:hypothetical protein
MLGTVIMPLTQNYIGRIIVTRTKEFIRHELQDDDAWVCICGNVPSGDGFFPCNKDGNEIEPTEESGWDGLYVCFQSEIPIYAHNIKGL